jgi:hypothetical protein
MLDRRGLFLSQRMRRFGTANPERVDLPHWDWMIRNRMMVSRVRFQLGIEFDYAEERPRYRGHEHADFCYQRHGATRTQMPDGRIIALGGEHEDYGMIDFCIYNDVFVLRPAPGHGEVTLDSGQIEIYLYPPEVFPPTDFHSATLVNDQIYIIGSLGYPNCRRLGFTPVYALDTNTYRIRSVECHGNAPGWISRHHASYDPQTNAITVRGGNSFKPITNELAPNWSTFRLYLDDMSWERLPQREQYRRFEFTRPREEARRREPTLEDLRPRHVEHTYVFPSDTGLPEDVCPEKLTIDVQGVRVEFLPWGPLVTGTFEGTLPQSLIDALLEDVRAALNQEGSHWTIREVFQF